ncbi:response regulator transcription factor [Actinomadura sp. WMMB 499]|uniref:response regulator n=1 Tax=Actinomadura sp. WMMB 499 TaxID=1219491 RepID=UPI001244CF4F|nr:response regulator transcription factor [Actinomadura sp. WMMB 499]QFG23568.1 response regulator transcription factor [Actinomadura sp. WMMB 499]
MTVRVLIADDQAVVRAGFRTILEAEPDIEITGEAADGADAVRLARRDRPDLVLMDVRMPVLDGIAATERLAGPDVADPLAVLIVTTFDLDEYVFAALRGGACGFLLKDIEPDDLVQAVRVVVSGQGLLAPAVTRRLIGEFARTSRASRPEAGPLPDLTARERDMLLLISRGLSNAEIADTLFLSVSTVKTHVARLLAKIDCRDRVHAVIWAYEHGMVEPGETP